MAVFKRTAEINMEKMIERLTASCVTSGQALVEARQEILALANKAIDEYLSAAQKYRDDIQAEVDKRVERWNGLDSVKAELEQKVKTAEAKLGAAMVAGKTAEEDAAELEISRLQDEIRKLDDRIRIFKGATFALSGSDGIKNVQAKATALEETIANCNKLMDEVNKAAHDHVLDMKDNMDRFNPGYPASIAGAYRPQVNINFPEELQLETLQRLASDDLTIEDLLKM